VIAPSLNIGSTYRATVDEGVDLCSKSETAPGVWYSLVGAGETITASLCGSTDPGFDTQIFVLTGPCYELRCRGYDDDSCGSKSRITWLAEESVTYFILVGGFGGSVGDFELEIRVED